MRKSCVVYFMGALTGVLLVSGCAGVLVGSAATSAVVAHDERTTGTFIEDQAIELKSIEAIRGKSDLRANTNLSVTSYNQVVLVTGQAPTQQLVETAISTISIISCNWCSDTLWLEVYYKAVVLKLTLTFLRI